MQGDHQADYSPRTSKSLYRSITTYVIALVVLVTIAVNSLAYFYSAHEEEVLYQNKLSSYAGYLSESLEWPLWNIDTELVGKIGTAFSSNAEIATLVIRDDLQQVVYQSRGSVESQFKREIEIRHDGARIGTVEIGLTSAELDKKDRQLLMGSIVSALLLIVVLLLVMRFILTRLFEAPVNLLIGVINDVVDGKYKQQFPVASHVEFAPILASFKIMSDTVASRELSLRDANEQLRFSERLLRQTQSVAKVGSWRLNVQSNELVWSDETYRMFDIAPGTLLTQQDFFEMVHPGDRDMVGAAWQAALKGAPFLVEHRIIIKGQTRWVEERAELECDAQGNLVAGIGSVQDITERKESEATLLKLSQAVEQSPSSVIITDLEARIEYANVAYTTVTGYTLDEVMGKNPRILQSGKTPKATYVDMWAKLARGETWQGELINRRKDGSEYVESAQISPVRQADGKITHYLGIKENITEKKKTAARIESLAHFDQLTGLPNRVLLHDRSRYAMSMAQRNGEQLVVMFIDLDHFKDINDTLGHSIGDLLLMEVSRRIRSVLREEDTVARLGGDEFILILPGTDEDGAMHVATKLVEEIAMPCQIEGHELVTTPSIGIAIYPHDGEDFEVLSKNADAAMYQAKQSGRNGFRFYTPEMQAHSSRNLQLANALRFALARNEFQLYYQPQLSIRDGHVIGVEALLRWQHPELGMVSPAEFIPVAEDSGMIIPIGEWVLRSAARQLREWMDKGLPPMMMAVNLSSVQFRQADMVDTVTRILAEVNLPCEYLEIELTEAVAMGDPKGAVAIMDRLHEQGIRMSIDDFGTGYSSLSYLKKFKVYKLKIDQSFVCDITDDADDKAIVTTIINMASSLGIRTLAEGVETAGQLAFLRMQGCDEVQGYYFSKPLPAEQFELFMKKAGM